jgi:putative nucleotidyltransferase with HDIG domain
MASENPAVPMTVTLVEDDPQLREVLGRALRSWGYSCTTARRAEEALERLEEQPTPIVVTDLRMPGRGGVWMVREIHQRWPEIAIIVLTGDPDSEAVIDCLNAGAHRYFLKPIRFDDFRHAVDATRHVCELRQARERDQLRLERAVRRQTRRVRSTFLSAIDSLVRTLEARDPYTTGHSLRVRHYALRLASVLGLSPREMKQLSLAAKLHDIGKVGIPEAVLNKPRELTADEFRVIQEHPVIGERILAPIIRDRAVLAAIRSHHERLDGAGYPDGLRAPDVPLLARVITVVDCFDALITSRAYRDALSSPDALEMLRAGAGTQFEPEFVRAFCDGVAPYLQVCATVSSV